jgi:hypothetical protein
MAQSPGGLADLYTDSASWSPGKTKYAEKLRKSLVSKRDQIIADIESCIRENGTIDNDKLLSDFGEKTQKQVLTYLRKESNRYLKLAMDADSGTEISDEYLLPLMTMKFDFSAFLANDPSTQRAARHEESIAKATELITDDGTFDFDAYDELDGNTKIGVMIVIKDRCTKYEQLLSSNDDVNTAEISDECLRRMKTVTFSISAFLKSKLKRMRDQKANRKRKNFHDTKKESNKQLKEIWTCEVEPEIITNNLHHKRKAVKRTESRRPVACMPALMRIDRPDLVRIEVFDMPMWLMR